MATQVSTIQVKGKLGNIVGYRGRRAKNLARTRVTEIKNPNTIGQAIQRMITATNARAYSRLKTICDHSFEGVSYGQLSQDFFLKKNAAILRQWVADQYPNSKEVSPREYVGLSGKESQYSTGVGLLISKGSLPTISPRSDADGLMTGFGANIPLTGETGPSVSAILSAIGAVPGDQISFVGLMADGVVQLARYVTKSDATAEQLAAVFTSQSFAAICNEKSIYNETLVPNYSRVSNLGFLTLDSLDNFVGVAAILSRKGSDGSWLRSTQTLVWTGDADTAGLESPQIVIPEWQAGVVQIDTENPYYLNQGVGTVTVRN